MLQRLFSRLTAQLYHWSSLFPNVLLLSMKEVLKTNDTKTTAHIFLSLSSNMVQSTNRYICCGFCLSITIAQQKLLKHCGMITRKGHFANTVDVMPTNCQTQFRNRELRMCNLSSSITLYQCWFNVTVILKFPSIILSRDKTCKPVGQAE